MEYLLLLASLAASLALNFYQLHRSKKPSPNRNQSLELQEFLADMMHGGHGLIGVKRIDPEDVLIRSPRNRA